MRLSEQVVHGCALWDGVKTSVIFHGEGVEGVPVSAWAPSWAAGGGSPLVQLPSHFVLRHFVGAEGQDPYHVRIIPHFSCVPFLEYDHANVGTEFSSWLGLHYHHHHPHPPLAGITLTAL